MRLCSLCQEPIENGERSWRLAGGPLAHRVCAIRLASGMDDHLAHVAYAAYAAALTHLAPWGVPDFDQLPDIHRRAWEAVARAVLDAVQAEARLEREPPDLHTPPPR
jgi:hypothetical protein